MIRFKRKRLPDSSRPSLACGASSFGVQGHCRARAATINSNGDYAMEERKEPTPVPLARRLARELTSEEVEMVSGGTGTAPGTFAVDAMFDRDNWYQI